VSILALSVVNTGARGLGEKEKEGEKAGAHVGGKGSGGLDPRPKKMKILVDPERSGR